MHADQVVEMATSLLVPTATATATPKPIPTIIPTPIEYQAASGDGHRTLWVMFAIMLASSGVFAVSSWNVPVSKRIFYVTTTLTAIIASLSYFALASGQAISYNCINVRDSHENVPDTFHDVCRQVYWARYVDWALTTPLLLLNLCLLAGVDGAHTLMAIAANVIMILSGLFSAFGTTGTAQKWGWYTIACASYVFVIWHVALHGARMSDAKGARVSKLFTWMAVFTFALWSVYPVVWAVADGARKINVDKEILIYAILDALAKPVFGVWLIISHRAMADTNIDLEGYWSHGLAADGRIRVGDEE
ncbi:putative opsin protein [Schizothecium vesticola]|uniref:Opsin protein n=1 Tax=Schizothecium vesticola TaxID=314040 RepID=A0AA40BPL9_9PEZI|nr:putative opsin protein [Schizothecium vesticola]